SIVSWVNKHDKERLSASRVLANMSDLREPHLWYPLTRLSKRKIIYHGG
ncbi:unnamed protein product, partial [Discosporangium mesarthrocarpum]